MSVCGNEVDYYIIQFTSDTFLSNFNWRNFNDFSIGKQYSLSIYPIHRYRRRNSAPPLLLLFSWMRKTFLQFSICVKLNVTTWQSSGDNIRCRSRIRGPHLMHRQHGDFVHYVCLNASASIRKKCQDGLWRSSEIYMILVSQVLRLISVT